MLFIVCVYELNLMLCMLSVKGDFLWSELNLMMCMLSVKGDFLLQAVIVLN